MGIRGHVPWAPEAGVLSLPRALAAAPALALAFAAPALACHAGARTEEPGDFGLVPVTQTSKQWDFRTASSESPVNHRAFRRRRLTAP